MMNTIMNDILQQAKNIASSDKGVLIVGEYGSGKSWLAKKIHQIGNRCDKPFLMVDCRIMEEHEAFKMLFGHSESNTIGARMHRGTFEQIQGGTLFFECFDSFSENIQKEILKVEQSSSIQRVGFEKQIAIQRPRIICSIEINANHIVRDKPFLTDTILTNDPYIIGQPPLRQRREDIEPLIETFLNQQFKSQPHISTKKVSPEVIYQCIRYDWPGNVKQLKNAIEHAAITSDRDEIALKDLPISIKSDPAKNGRLKQLTNSPSYKKAEMQLIKRILEETDSPQKTAALLGIEQSSLETKMKGLNLLSENSNP